MRIRTITANILLPAGIGIAVAVTWFVATGDVTPPLLTVVGLALFAGGLGAGTQWAAERVTHALRRRVRPSRHRKPAPSTPLPERANPLTTTPEGEA